MSSEIEQVVFDWLTRSLVGTPFEGTTIVRAEQNGPRPSEPYVVYKVVNLVPENSLSFDARGEDEDNLRVSHYERNRVLVSLNAYSPLGREILTAVKFSGKIWEVRRNLENSKFSLLRVGAIQDLTALGDTRFERRFSADCEFLAWTTRDEIRPRVKEITVTGNYPGN